MELVGNLAINDEAKFEIRRVGLIPTLISLLKRAQNPGYSTVGSLAARAIATLAFNGTLFFCFHYSFIQMLILLLESNREAVRESGGLEVLAHLLRSPVLPKTEAIDAQNGNDNAQNGKDNEEASLLGSAVWAIEALSVSGKYY